MIQSIILGVIQGLTEFIPVSSSGHLVLTPEILGWEPQSTTFDVILHGGTLLALIVIFRKKILTLITHPIANKHLIISLIITSIPAGIVGLLFENKIDEIFKSTDIVAVMLISVGLAMLLADTLPKRKSSVNKTPDKHTAFIIGLFQTLSLIRGTSRSGITILGGLSQKLSLKEATEYAFLASIPLIGGAFLVKLTELISNGTSGESTLNLSIGFMSAFVAGIIAIKFMLNQIENLGLKYFGIYRIILGVLIIIIL